MAFEVRKVAPLTIQDVAVAGYDAMAEQLSSLAIQNLMDADLRVRAAKGADIANRAAQAEHLDPAPPDAPDCAKHLTCAAYRFAAADKKPVPKEERL